MAVDTCSYKAVGSLGMTKNPVEFLQLLQHTLEFLEIFKRIADALQDCQ